MPFACDRHLPEADAAYFRAIDVEAPASTVFRWLCQLRVAPYSYDWIDNFGRRSPQRLTPGLERLEVGQRVMTFAELVEFECNRQLTVVAKSPRAEWIFGRIAVTYSVLPRADAAARWSSSCSSASRTGPPDGRCDGYSRGATSS